MTAAASPAAEPGFDDRHIPPDATFFMTVLPGRDGTVDLSRAPPVADGTVRAAVATAREDVGESGGFAVVYECRPVRRVSAGEGEESVCRG